eukprot:gene22382-29488_t
MQTIRDIGAALRTASRNCSAPFFSAAKPAHGSGTAPVAEGEVAGSRDEAELVSDMGVESLTDGVLMLGVVLGLLGILTAGVLELNRRLAYTEHYDL